MQLDHTFEDMLSESYQTLFENTMTSPQRRLVASLRGEGWRIVQDTKSKDVSLTNGIDSITISPTGDINHLNESVSSVDELNTHLDNMYLSEAMSLLEENIDSVESIEVEEQKRSIGQKIRILLDNLTIITLQRGNDVYIVSMSRHSNEYAKLSNNNITESGNLHNRRTATSLVDRLKASGFIEVDWKSAVPKGVMKTTTFMKNQIPTIAVLFVLWAFAPGLVTAIASFAVRMVWTLIGPIINALPLPNLQVMSDVVDSALKAIGQDTSVEVDGWTGG